MDNVSRRSFLHKAGLLGLGIPLGGALLQGCGSDSGSGSGSGSGESTGSAKPGQDKDVAKGQKFLLSLPTSNNIYFDGWTEASKAAAAALGMGVHYENYNFDNAKQLASFQNVTNLDLKAVITSANSAATSPSLMRLCQRQQAYGINTWSNQPFDTPLDVGDYYLNYFETATDTGFEALCTYLFTELGGSGKVIHISGVAGNLSSDRRDMGVDRALKKFPNIEMVARQYGGYSRVTTTPAVENLLTAHPDVKAIICQNDDSAMGALSVLKKRGIKALVTGGDGVPEFLDAIAAGDGFATMVHSGPWLGAASVARIYDAINGVKLDPLERMLRFEGFVCNTPEAATAYKKLMFSGNGFPFDYKKMSRFLHPDDWDMQHAITPIVPEDYWSHLEKDRPKGYEFPKPYRNATEADYQKIQAMYKQHLTSNPYDAVKKLCKPAPISDFPDA
jgi:ribose transport system substrate-binding protein